MLNHNISGFVILLMLLTLGCGRRSHDPRLERIRETVCSNPRAALQSLDSIDPAALPEKDRAFLHLLTIKARDKAYIRHTSDSLVMAVISYYTRHRDKDLYPEALYYGGRVYSDLGDYPTALRYFQDALDLLPGNTPNIKLRGNVLSQTGGLLNDLGLYREAIPYIRDVLIINKETNDTVNMFLNYKMLGAIYLHLRYFDKALNNFNDADKLSVYVPHEYTGEIKMYEAAVCYYKNEIKDALKIIRTIPQITDSLSRNLILAYASKIYLKAGVLDTAYMYAHELVLSNFSDNKKTGYMVMLTPEIKPLIPKDSMDLFYCDYKNVLETEFRHQEDNHALMQNAMYNYRIHDKKKQEAEHSRDRVVIYTAVLIAIISILSAFIFWLLYNRKSNLVKLHEALDKLDFIEQTQREDLEKSTEFPIEDEGMENKMNEYEVSQIIKDEKTLKEELRNKYRVIKDKAQSYDISQRILTSRPYTRLQSLLKSNSPLPNEHNIFVELENVIIECYPDFKSRLLLLADGNLKDEDLELSMLIRCGFTPKELSVLLGRANSTVTYRRKKLCRTLLGDELDLEVFDAIMRSL